MTGILVSSGSFSPAGGSLRCGTSFVSSTRTTRTVVTADTVSLDARTPGEPATAACPPDHFTIVRTNPPYAPTNPATW